MLRAIVFCGAIAFCLYEPQREISSQSISTQDRPNMPYKMLALIYGVALFYMVAFYLIPVQLPFYLQNLDGSSASAAGLAIAASTLASSIASFRYSFVKERLGFVQIVTVSFGIAAIGYFIIGLANSYNLVLIGLIVAGLGFGLLMPNLNVWLSSTIPDLLRGRALGGLTAFFFLGQFLSPLVSQPITNAVGLDKTYIFTGVALIFIAMVFIGLKQEIRSFCQNC